MYTCMYIAVHPVVLCVIVAVLSLSDMQSTAQGSLDELQQQIFSMSSFSGVQSESDAFTSQLVNCHAVVSESGELCARVNTVPAYLEINRVVRQCLNHH